MKNSMKLALSTIALLSIAACSSNKDLPKLDYQTENRKIVNLEVPPDLTNPNQGDLYQIPAGVGAVRASDMNRAGATQQPANQAVLQGVKGVHLERDGNQRWLAISSKTPAEIWSLLKVFWQENGFDIKSEEPAIGQMETEWAENRAKIPQDGLRRLFEKVGLGGVYSTSERDKFIIRLEKGSNGDTDVFFAHKGLAEVYGDKNKDTTMWQPRPNDPNLEAAFLARFMQYLGADEQQVQHELAQSTQAASSDLARLENDSLLLKGDYERNWRRVLLALERVGLTVVGQNTQNHSVLTNPAPEEGNSVVDANKPGLFQRWFGKSKSEDKAAAKPEVIVYIEPVSGGARIRLFNRDGSAYTGKQASTWLSRLYTELR